VSISTLPAFATAALLVIDGHDIVTAEDATMTIHHTNRNHGAGASGSGTGGGGGDPGDG
jgi:hypothetical protein